MSSWAAQTVLIPTHHFQWQPILQRLQDEGYRLLAGLPLLLVAIIVVWVAWHVGGWLSRRAALDHVSRRNPFMRDITRTTVRWIATLGGVLLALEILNATALVGAVLGTAGVIGVALGFAFKDILENYLAGILMSLRQPFAPNDHVVIEGNEGMVIALTSRATILMTLDGNHLRLPNALVFRGVTLNYTRNPSRRFDFAVGIGVNEDLVRAQRIGIDELGRMQGVMPKPPPRALIVALADSNVQVSFSGWVDQGEHDFRVVKSEAIRRVKRVLDDAGMDMPEPIYRVQIEQRTAVEVPTQRPATLDPELDADVDTRAQADLDAQIQHDREERPAGENLLDPAAPKE